MTTSAVASTRASLILTLAPMSARSHTDANTNRHRMGRYRPSRLTDFFGDVSHDVRLTHHGHNDKRVSRRSHPAANRTDRTTLPHRGKSHRVLWRYGPSRRAPWSGGSRCRVRGPRIGWPMAKTRIAVIALAAVALFVVPASAAKVQRCGPYSKDDGSLADGVVLNIKVVGMSCKTGQTVANGYHGVVGPFKAYGFMCLAQQAGNPPQQAGSVRCVKGPRRMSYANGPMNDCSTTPGILVPQSTATPISGRGRTTPIVRPP